MRTQQRIWFGFAATLAQFALWTQVAHASPPLSYNDLLSSKVTSGDLAVDGDATTATTIASGGYATFVFTSDTPASQLTLVYSGTATINWYDSMGNALTGTASAPSGTNATYTATVPQNTHYARVYGTTVSEITPGGPSLSTAAPTAPTAWQASGIGGANSALLQWSPYTSSANAPKGIVSGYRIYRDGSLVGTVPVASPQPSTLRPSSSPGFMDAGLTPGQAYSYAVAAYSSVGESARSGAITVTPTAPGTVSYYSAAGSATVSGQNAVDGDLSTKVPAFTGNQAFVFNAESVPTSLDLIANTGTPTVSFYDSLGNSLSAGTTTSISYGAGAGGAFYIRKAVPNKAHFFFVNSVEVQEISPVGPAQAVPVPTAPNSWKAVAMPASGSVQVFWSPAGTTTNAPAGIVAGYRVYRNGSLIATVPLGTTDANFRQSAPGLYMDSSVTNGQSYNYEITAYNQTGASAKSPAMTVSPVAPGAIVYNPADNGGLDGRGAIDGDLSTSGNSIASGTIKYVFPGAPPVTLDLLASAASSIQFYDGTGTSLSATATTSQSYGSGGPLNYTKFTVPTGARYFTTTAALTEATASIALQNVAPPAVSPTSFSASVGDSMLTLRWYRPSGVVLDGYRLYRDGALIATTTATSYTDAGLINRTTYNYQVTGFNQGGEGPRAAVSGQPNIIPHQPTLTGSTSAASVSLSWTPASTGGTPDWYKIYRNGTVIATTMITTYEDVSVTAGTAYTYEVSAGNSAGETKGNALFLVPGPTPDMTLLTTPSAEITNPAAAIDRDFSTFAQYSRYSGGLLYRLHPTNTLSTVTISHQSWGGSLWVTFKDSAGNTTGSGGGLYSGDTHTNNFTVPAGTAYMALTMPSDTYSYVTDNVRIYEITASGAKLTLSAPTAPSNWNLNVLGADGKSIVLFGSNNAANLPKGLVEGYKLYRNNTLIATVPLPQTGKEFLISPHIVDSLVTNEETYDYQVSVFNSAGESAKSLPATATPVSQGPQVRYADEKSGGVANALKSLDGDVSTFGASQSFASPGSSYKYDGYITYELLGTTTPGFIDVLLDGNASNIYFYDSNMTGMASASVVKSSVMYYADTNATAQLVRVNLKANTRYVKIGMRKVYELVVGGTPINPVRPPTNLVASAGDTTVDLTWAAPTTGDVPAGYQVYRNDVRIATTTLTTYSDTSVNNGVTYTYAVKTYTSSGESSPVTASARPMPPSPGAPSSLSGQVQNVTYASAEAALSWAAPTSGGTVANYRIYRDGTLIASVTSGTTHTDGNLPLASSYSYAVRSYNVAGESPDSNSVTVNTPQPPPPAPSNLRTSPADGSVELRWDAPLSPVQGYNVYRDGSKLATVTGAPGTTAALLQSLSRTSVAIAGDVPAASTAGTPPTTYTDMAVTNGIPYDYKVSSFSASGESTATAAQTATPNAVPGTPQSVAAAPGDTSVLLTWEAPATGGAPDYYQVYRNDVLVGSVTGTDYLDTTVTNNTTYNYYLIAVNTGGSSAPSSTVSATPAVPSEYTPAVPPGAVQVTPQTDKVVIVWDAPPGVKVKYYKVYRDGVDIAHTTETTYTDYNVTKGVTYEYSVCWVSEKDVESPKSEPQPVTPNSPPGTPQNPKISPSPDGNLVEWDPPKPEDGGPPDSYDVIRDGQKIGTTPTPNFLDPNPPTDHTPVYQVIAKNPNGASPPSPPAVQQPLPPAPPAPPSTPPTSPSPTDPTIPPVPTTPPLPTDPPPADEPIKVGCAGCPPANIEVKAVTAFSAAVTWDLMADDKAKGYRVYMGDELLGEVDNPITAYYVMDLEPGQSYSFSVTSLTPTGKESPRSEPTTVTMPYNYVSGTVAPGQALPYERPLRIQQNPPSKRNEIHLKVGSAGFPVATNGVDELNANFGSVPGGHRVELVNSAGEVLGATRAKADGTWTIISKQPFQKGDILTIRFKDM